MTVMIAVIRMLGVRGMTSAAGLSYSSTRSDTSASSMPVVAALPGLAVGCSLVSGISTALTKAVCRVKERDNDRVAEVWRQLFQVRGGRS